MIPLKQCDYRHGCNHEFPEHYFSDICGDFHLPILQDQLRPMLWRIRGFWRGILRRVW